MSRARLRSDKWNQREHPTVNRLLILYSSHSAVCGIGTWIECLAEQLTLRQWDVVVGLSWGQKFHKPDAVEEMRPGLQLVRLDGRTGTQAGRYLAIRNAIRRIKPDLVLVTLLDDGLRVMQREKHLGSKVRFGFANHGNSPGDLAAAIELSDELDLVVSVNRASYQLLRDWPTAKWAPGSLQCISNAVPAAIVAHQSQHDKIRLGFVGRLTTDKGAEQIEPLLAALREKNCHFVLTIAGDGPFGETMTRLAAQFPEQVQYLGQLSRDQLYRQVYPKLDVIICLSPSEGWPMAIAEAMVHGVVPVSSEYTGVHLEDVIRHNETGVLFPVGQPEIAADRIFELAQDSARLADFQAAAQRIMTTQHSPEQFGNRWDECLRRALERESSRSAATAELPGFSVADIVKEWVRRFLGRSVLHRSVRAEWPMIAPRNERLIAEVQQCLSETGIRGSGSGTAATSSIK